MRERVISPVGRIFVVAFGLLLMIQFSFFAQYSQEDSGIETTSEAEDQPFTKGSDEAELLQSVDYLSDTVWIPQGGQFYIRYDEATNSLVEMRKPDPTAGMPQAFIDAINRSPNWLKDNITRKFEQLVDTDIDIGMNSAPEFADLDGDGDMDLIVGTQIGTLDYFENIDPALHYYEGHDVFIGGVYKKNTSMFFGVSVTGRAHPAIADITRDGLLDLLIGTQAGEIHLFENWGTPSLPVWAPVTVLPTVIADSGSASIDVEDINFDTYPDIILGEGKGTLHYYENQMGSFVEIMVGLEWTDLGDMSAPRYADMDDDGDFDITAGDSVGGLHYFRNDTTNWTYDPLMYE
ncbi:MAG: VCBS repeat-containing protein, partial [Methanobacteriota archaeon]